MKNVPLSAMDESCKVTVHSELPGGSTKRAPNAQFIGCLLRSLC